MGIAGPPFEGYPWTNWLLRGGRGAGFMEWCIYCLAAAACCWPIGMPVLGLMWLLRLFKFMAPRQA